MAAKNSHIYSAYGSTAWSGLFISALHGVWLEGILKIWLTQGQLESTEGSLTFSPGTCTVKIQTAGALRQVSLSLDIGYVSIWTHWCKYSCSCTTTNCLQLPLHHGWLSEAEV